MKLKKFGIALAVSAGLLCGCAGVDEAKVLASAKQHLSSGNPSSAIVEIKLVLQKNPQSALGRYLLGQAFAATGESAAAAVELSKALELKHPEQEVLPLLAQAWLYSGQAKLLTTQLSERRLSDARADADLRSEVASAWAAQGASAESNAAVDAALARFPKHLAARLLKARQLASEGDIDAALGLVNSVVTDDAKYKPGLQLQAELLWRGKRDIDSSVVVFRRLLSLDKAYLQAHLALISILVQRGDLPGMKAQFSELQKVLPKNPETKFLEAQIAFIDRDTVRARALTAELLKRSPDNARLLQLAGQIELQAGSLAAAERHLTKAVQRQALMPGARRALAEVNLRSGQPGSAIATLQPVLDSGQAEAPDLALSAESYLFLGNLKQAEALFAKASKARPGEVRYSTALAMADIVKGNTSAGFTQLESLAATSRDTFADMALISSRLRRGESNEAVKAIVRLKEKLPNRPLPNQLLGRIELSQKRPAEARKNFEAALAIDPNYMPAITNLSALDVIDKQPEQALKRLEALIKRDPNNVQGLLALAEIKSMTGSSPAEIEAVIVSAVKANPGEPAPRVRLIDHLLSQNMAKTALSAARDATAAIPDNGAINEALGRASLKSGDAQQALSAYKRAVVASPNSPQALVRLAEIQLRLKDTDSAQKNLRRAIELSPGLGTAHRLLATISIREGRADEALASGRRLQKQQATAAVGFSIEGEAQGSKRRWPQAASAFQSALQRSGDAQDAIGLHLALLSGGQDAEARRVISEWEKAHPTDLNVPTYVALSALARGDCDQAAPLLRKIVAQQPNDASTVNNLAWCATRQGDPAAVQLAERANALLPNNASILDTLASALAAQKQFAKAIEIEQKALELSPDGHALRLNFARILLQSGDKARAKVELEKLAYLGQKFDGQSEVTELMRKAR